MVRTFVALGRAQESVDPGISSFSRLEEGEALEPFGQRSAAFGTTRLPFPTPFHGIMSLMDWEGSPVDVQSILHVRTGISMLTIRHVIDRTLKAPPTPTPVDDLQGIMRFLKSCRYARDLDASGTLEHWQTPWEFEKKRVGDCEDHALWAWRKCLDLSLPARFAFGFGPGGTGHAWVQIHARTSWILETTEKSPHRTGVLALSEAWEYRPGISVNGSARFFVHRAPEA